MQKILYVFMEPVYLCEVLKSSQSLVQKFVEQGLSDSFGRWYLGVYAARTERTQAVILSLNAIGTAACSI
jgi:hypothetical protein